MNKLKERLPFFLWLFLLFSLTSLPGKSIPPMFNGSDILAHLFLYMTLSLFFLYGFKKKKYITLILIVAVAAIDETHQYFIPMRNPSIIDFTTDLLGGGSVLCLLNL